MAKVTGIGGVFFKARDPKALEAWYAKQLGIDVSSWGGAAFDWKGPDNPEGAGTTAWSIFPVDAKKFGPSSAPFMINYRVTDLHGILAALRSAGAQVEDKVDESEYGKFGWAMDPEGNKIELWEPPAGQ